MCAQSPLTTGQRLQLASNLFHPKMLALMDASNTKSQRHAVQHEHPSRVRGRKGRTDCAARKQHAQ
eukprot:1149254-Pelagomonas_calceolata.AAC.10